MYSRWCTAWLLLVAVEIGWAGPAAAQHNLIGNGTFVSDTSPWTTQKGANGQYVASPEIVTRVSDPARPDGVLRLTIARDGQSEYYSHNSGAIIALTSGIPQYTVLRLQFWAKAVAAARWLSVSRVWGGGQVNELIGTEWAQHVVYMRVDHATDHLAWSVVPGPSDNVQALSDGTILLDDIQVTLGDPGDANMAVNGNLEHGLSPWSGVKFQTGTPLDSPEIVAREPAFAETMSAGLLRLTVAPQPGYEYYSHNSGASCPLTSAIAAGSTVRVRFKAKSVSGSRWLSISRTWGGGEKNIQITESWGTYEVTFLVQHTTPSLMFGFVPGDSTNLQAMVDGVALIDDVDVRPVDAAALARPKIFQFTKRALPGDIVSLIGSGFGSTPQIFVDPGDGAGKRLVSTLLTNTSTSGSTPSNQLSFALPSSLPAGMYAVSVATGSAGESEPVYINRAEPWSTLDLAGDEVTLTSTFRVYGLNLAFASAKPTVKLVELLTGSSYVVPAADVLEDSSSPYTLRIHLQNVAGLELRSYRLRLSNGYGGAAGEVDGPVVHVVSGAAMAGLPPWTSSMQAAAQNRVSADSFGITPCVSSPCVSLRSALQAAVDDLHDEGGGTLVLPAGDYNVGAGIYLRPHVVLEGAAPSSVGAERAWPTVLYADQRPTTAATPYLDSSSAVIGAADASGTRSGRRWMLPEEGPTPLDVMSGIRNLRIESRLGGPVWGIAVERARHFFVETCYVENLNDEPGVLTFQESTNVALRDNHFVHLRRYPGGSLSQGYNSFLFGFGRQLQIEGNVFEYLSGRIALNVARTQFEGNELRHWSNIPGTSVTPPAGSRGVFMNGAKNVAVLSNRVVKLGSLEFPPQNQNNDGETFAFDQEPQPGYGYISAATSNTLTTRDIDAYGWPARDDCRTPSGGPDVRCNGFISPPTKTQVTGDVVTIVGGPGAGQIRHVTGHDDASKALTIDRPWDVVPVASSVPGASSRYAITHAAENVLFYDNDLSSQYLGGINFYGGPANNVVIAANELTDAAGIHLLAIPNPNYYQFTVYSNVLALNNELHRTRTPVGNVNVRSAHLVLERAAGSSEADARFGTAIFAPVFRQNVLQAASPNISFDVGNDERGDGVTVWGTPLSSTWQPFEAILGAVFDRNVISGISDMYRIDQAATGTTLRATSTSSSPGLVLRELNTVHSTGTYVQVQP